MFNGSFVIPKLTEWENGSLVDYLFILCEHMTYSWRNHRLESVVMIFLFQRSSSNDMIEIKTPIIQMLFVKKMFGDDFFFILQK